METRFRRSVVDLGEESYFELMSEVNRNMRKIMRSSPGSNPYVSITQSRFPSRRSKAIKDGTMNFDLRTAFDGVKDRDRSPQNSYFKRIGKRNENSVDTNSHKQLEGGQRHECAKVRHKCTKT